MLRPDQLTNIRSRELKIDLEKEQFEEVNVQLSSSDDEKPKSKSNKKPVERSVPLITENKPTTKETTSKDEYPAGMLRPEQLTNIRSRELKIDLEKEQFEEVNVQLSSSDDEKPKSKSNKKPVERSVPLITENKPTTKKTTNKDEYPAGMLRPEQLTNIRSRELKIDLEKEQFEEVNVQLSSSDDEKPKSKSNKKPVERSVPLITENKPTTKKTTSKDEYPAGMLRPEQLTNIRSRELKIDLEKEQFEEVNVQLSSSDDEKPKSKSNKKPVERSVPLITENKPTTKETTSKDEYPAGMLRPEQLTNIRSRELKIDLEKEQFEEVNVQLSSSDDEKPKSKSNKKPVERSVPLITENKPTTKKTTSKDEYPAGMLRPEQLTNIRSRELKIDLEKEQFEEVNVQLSSSDDEKPKSKSNKKPVERSVPLITENKPTTKKTTSKDEYPAGMLRPEQLTNIRSRELKIDLEKEQFEEVNVQLSSSDDEKPKSKSNKKPVERSVPLITENKPTTKKTTSKDEYPAGMLRPEQLTNIRSRELKIDLEKEQFEEVNVQLSSSDDEKPKSKSNKKPVERSVPLITENKPTTKETTSKDEYPAGMLRPEQLTNIRSRELKIDLEKEQFEEVNVQLSSSDDEKPKSKSNKKPVERSVPLITENKPTTKKTTSKDEYPAGMLRPEQLTNIRSRELKIDLEKEQFEEVNVQLSSSDDEKPKSKSNKKPVERSVPLITENKPTTKKTTNKDEYPAGMLRPEQLTNIRSRELKIDLEKEQFEEVNVQLSSSDDEKPKSKSNKKPVERSVPLITENKPTTKKTTSKDEYPAGMLRPEQLTNIRSRELKIDLEKEQFEEVNVQLSSSDDEKPKSKSNKKPVERSVPLVTDCNDDE